MTDSSASRADASSATVRVRRNDDRGFPAEERRGRFRYYVAPYPDAPRLWT